LVRIYLSFRREYEDEHGESHADHGGGTPATSADPPGPPGRVATA